MSLTLISHENREVTPKQMAISLVATGWWMWIDVPVTPQAVVVCVIVFNAAFGYSWGPIPWLYPPEVRVFQNVCVRTFIYAAS